LLKYSYDFLISWDKIVELSKDENVTIGAHTVSHLALSKISKENMITEIFNSKQIIENKINKKVEHFANPFGSKFEISNREIEAVKNLNFKTAVTTLNGNIFNEHKNLLHFLPRVFLSDKINTFALNVRLNGIYQYLSNKNKKIDLSI
jgi:peptidoglycan/xylan/chitin deacetylase (PgdA/CDA1 family)